MIKTEDFEYWRLGGKRYLFALWLLEQKYKKGEIKKKEKKKMERVIDSLWDIHHWENNPHLKENPLLCEVAMSFLKDTHLTYVFRS